ncbi:serine/threonine protein kinase [Nostoc piscinale CENA21]|uniref:Serine/threonine protein kinase n=1 Tax=Nostoc piscinale CENA21 TaxID=224013 RepID=A0A0M4TLH0_9NOSO|nr:AAA-like domain-containing protein [Nostoc piscinale]ALF54049.1 serine/threonine protein kinase [Nostoc piscinale CENA21]
MYATKARRRRGVILTPQGLKKLQTAKSEAEIRENNGHRYTLEVLSDRTGLSVDTIMKIFACEVGVDKQTLKHCFQAFNLVLEQSDYCFPDLPQQSQAFSTNLSLAEAEPEIPEGQVPLDSRFYVERPPIEANCYKAILQPGALIRIKAPRRMGKTSLMSRILKSATNESYHTVFLSFQLADKAIFQDLDKFLRWFCASVSLGLELQNQLTEYWDELFGSKISAKIYFEQYLLAKTISPIVLGLDDIDRLFQYPDLADDFFGLLRAWHEEAKNREIWKKLRLIVAHATEVYIPLSVNKSPFNVGLPVELQSLNQTQVKALGDRYGLNFCEQSLEKLFALVGGQPYLVRLACYYLWQHRISVEELLSTALSSDGIYREHLQQQWWNLQQNPELVRAFAQVIKSSQPVELNLQQAFKLQSMGLVNLYGNQATPSCRLYAEYFCDRLHHQPESIIS